MEEAELERKREESDRAVRAELDRLMALKPTSEQEAGEHVGLSNYWLHADHWFSLFDLEPTKAAMLLCNFNPHNVTLEQAQRTTTDFIAPRDLVCLAERFNDLANETPQPRSLLRWLQITHALKLRHDPWIDQYVDARTLVDSTILESAATVDTAPVEPPPEPATAVLSAVEQPAQAEPVPSVNASIEPVKKSEPPPLTTPEIAEAFDGIDGKTATQWRNWLGDVNNHKWLLPARAVQVTAPKSSTWWPIVFANLLLNREVSDDSLKCAFVNSPKLKPWLHLWQEQRRERNAFGQ